MARRFGAPRRSGPFALVALIVSVGAAVAVVAESGQLATPARSKIWVGQTDRIETLLKSAEVVRIEDIDTGVTRPRRAFLEPGGIVESFTWKMLPPGRRSGYYESYKSEIAAYELDKRLALNMVPPAVEREVRGERGAAVMWVDGTVSVKELGGTLPAGRVPGSDVRKMQLFDNFIGNPDRNGGNILVDASNHVILIDHSRAFLDNPDLPTKFERVDEDLWTAIEALAPENLRTLLRPLIGDAAVEAMIQRRARLKKTIDGLVAKKGRTQVLIPSNR